MKAWIAPTSTPLSPWGDLPDTLPVLGRPLRAHQEEALRGAGLELVATPPEGEPFVQVGARCWFTAALLRRFLGTLGTRGNPADGGRLRLDHPAFEAFTEPLQDLPDSGIHEVALVPAGGRPGAWDLPLVDVAPDLTPMKLPAYPPGLQGAGPSEVPTGEEMVHQVDHWSHLLRVNLLALMAGGAAAARHFLTGNALMRVARGLGVLVRAGGTDPARVGRVLSTFGPGCRIHPTAVVEFSVLGRNVVVGPFAVVRGSVLADDAQVEEQAIVNLTSVGARARVGRQGIVNLCVLMEGAHVSLGHGFQASIFGRDSFVAMSAGILDLSFAGDVKVTHRGARVSAGTPFLGAAVGHGARIGASAWLGYGAEVPNGASVVMDPTRVLRSWPEDGRTMVKL